MQLTTTTNIMLIGIASVASIVTASSNCFINATEEGHPLVNLSSLHNTVQDYKVVSSSNPAYTYYFNLCGETVFQDSICSEGSTVCEIKNLAAQDVYGYVDTISLSWQGSMLVMKMVGEPECPFNKLIPYTSEVDFICSGESRFQLKTENYYQCALQFEYYTPLVCGGDPPVPPPPSPPAPNPPPPDGSRYSCYSNFSCHVTVDGAFGDQTECQATCTPFQKHYTCFNQRCVSDSRGTYIGEASCLAECAPPVESKYTCGDDYTCTEDASGSFPSEADCELNCHDPSATLWHCDDSTGKCVVASEGFPSEEYCNSICSTEKSPSNSFLDTMVVTGRDPELQ